jgi:hypothetical protein
MRTKMIVFLALILLTAASAAVYGQTRRTNRSTNVNVNGEGPVTDCRDIRVTYDRQPAIAEESEMSLPASQVSTLRTQMGNGGAYINGWDRNEYSVKTCKAVPDDSNATSTLREINTANNGGQLTVNGPSDREWTVNLIIMAPRLSRLDIETRNGPLQLRELAGVIRISATNGPIGLHNVGGSVEATTTNGPISLRGGSGDQHVSAVNGPVSVELSGSRWDGPGLEVSTRNGPLSIGIPDGYGSGIAVQTSDRSPVNCKASVCANAVRTLNSPSTFRIGSGDPTVRLSTSNGPLSIQSAKN